MLRLDGDDAVFRLVNNQEIGPTNPPGDDRPPPDAFRLSDTDKTSDPPYLSVWDSARTTSSQAVEIRTAMRRADGSERPVDASAWSWRVKDIRAIPPLAGVHPPDDRQLDVERRPEDEKWGPGADGHCGILGPLEGIKPVRRHFQQELASLCKRGVSGE